jgi:hypothetical protein
MVKEGSWYNPSMDCCTSDMPSTGGVSSAELPVSLWHQELYREQIDGSSDSSGTWSQRGGYMDRAADREEEIAKRFHYRGAESGWAHTLRQCRVPATGISCRALARIFHRLLFLWRDWIHPGTLQPKFCCPTALTLNQFNKFRWYTISVDW